MAEETTEVVLDQPADEAKEGEEVVKLDQKIDVTDSGPCLKHVKVTVPAADVKRYFDKEVGKFVKEAAVPGFRPGKTPRKLIERKFRTEAADGVKSAILTQSLQQIDEEKVLDLISEPELKPEAVVLPEEGDLVYEFNAEVRPTFDLPDMRELTVDRPSHTVTDADVDAEIEAIRFRFAAKEEKDGPAERGDYLRCDIRVKDGERNDRRPRRPGSPRRRRRLLQRRSNRRLRQVDGRRQSGRPPHASLDAFQGNRQRGRGRQDALRPKSSSRRCSNRRRPRSTKTSSRISASATSANFATGFRRSSNSVSSRSSSIRCGSRSSASLLETTKIELPNNLLRRQADQELRKRVVELSQAGYTEEDIRNEINRLRQQAVANTAFFMKERFLIERIAENEKIEVTEDDLDAGIEELSERFSESSRRVRAGSNATA